MLDQEEEIDNDEELSQTRPLNRKKLLILLLPVVIVIGLSVGFYYAFNQDYRSTPNTYSIVKRSGAQEGEEGITVFYDLPEFSANLHGEGPNKQFLHIKLNIELSSIEDVKTIEALTPKINDVVLTHIIELTPGEIEGSAGLYWLKEELLYRLNLATAPIKINNLNIQSVKVETASD